MDSFMNGMLSWLSSNPLNLFLLVRWFFCDCLSFPGGHVRARHPSGALPRLASIRQLPGQSVRRSSPDCGHAGGTSLRHGGERGPGNGHVRPQHGALQAAGQSHREVPHIGSTPHRLMVTAFVCVGDLCSNIKRNVSFPEELSVEAKQTKRAHVRALQQL